MGYGKQSQISSVGINDEHINRIISSIVSQLKPLISNKTIEHEEQLSESSITSLANILLNQSSKKTTNFVNIGNTSETKTNKVEIDKKLDFLQHLK